MNSTTNTKGLNVRVKRSREEQGSGTSNTLRTKCETLLVLRVNENAFIDIYTKVDVFSHFESKQRTRVLLHFYVHLTTVD